MVFEDWNLECPIIIYTWSKQYLKAGGGEGADGPGGIAGDKMVRKWYLGEEQLCNFFIDAIL